MREASLPCHHDRLTTECIFNLDYKKGKVCCTHPGVAARIKAAIGLGRQRWLLHSVWGAL